MIPECTKTSARIRGLATFALLGFSATAHAQGAQLFELTLSGSYSERFSEYKTNRTKSWGAELRLPLTHFFEVSVGHSFMEDKDTFNEKYRAMQQDLGYTLPEGSIESIDTYIDTTTNAALFYTFGYLRPSIFGGALWRTYCSENTLADYGCQDQDVTWNAGAALSVIITYNLRLRASVRYSPSVVKDNEDQKYDQSTSLGLTFVL
jgi:hypothetical protein